jgi:hypothetical protein
VALIHDLDHEAALDPVRVGAKASWLARGRRSGLPVLPGLVVDTAASRDHMWLGAEKLATRGSGGARLAVTGEPVPFGDELVERGTRLSDLLVARSSTILEASGAWSGAFTSYLDLAPDDLPRAVTGCWASAFSVASLDRQVAAGTTPGSVEMAVLIQPALESVAGGTAAIYDDGHVVVTGIKGSPAPLLQGWSNGLEGDELVGLLGRDVLEEIATALRRAVDLGANRCEWTLDGQIWILQLGVSDRPEREGTVLPSPVESRLIRIARAVSRHGGDVWEQHLQALGVTGSAIATLLGSDPGPTLDMIEGLGDPDLVPELEGHPSSRRGVGRWEPFVASVVLSAGTHHKGTPASPGIGAGLATRDDFQPRSVIVAAQPVPNLASLLWDAAGLVTESGSPAAHLFESARALRVPAVCGVTIPTGDQIVAIDGQNGLVATLPLQDAIGVASG